MCTYILYIRLYPYYTYIYVCIFENRSGLYMRVSVRVLMDRLYVRMRWWACAAATAAHCIHSAPGAPSISLPDLYIATCAYL